MQRRTGLVILTMVMVMFASYLFSLPRIPQSASYHNFADQRCFFGIPNFLDVVSNLPFLIVGICGLGSVISGKYTSTFLVESERRPFVVFFLGVALTCFGSSYYHLHPTNTRLVWDRLPMTLGFMGILSASIAERISVKAGTRLLLPLVAAGVGSVFYWFWTEARGRGDLRSYSLVQFGSLFVLLVMLVLFRQRYTQSWCLWAALAFYVAAKLLESFDREIYSVRHLVSGHTLKHLAAATAAYFILRMTYRRAACPACFPVCEITETPAGLEEGT